MNNKRKMKKKKKKKLGMVVWWFRPIKPYRRTVVQACLGINMRP
jgi:hypothetical protein